ncbi:DUF192 domain-containing protein [Calothrix sp. PCC 6303]|uniref:DUF192 domain-containing protein n=1 Tax=Calothrix sp. PCC 6303 TaxID=1170562 RepID=UPI0002A01B59|nr:DUF192 domain-containing protein [Calothrix sp. PCC 6303]AFZ03870.1 protein of unknown function DUF192 [Calothrix sp. PCC 6303]
MINRQILLPIFLSLYLIACSTSTPAKLPITTSPTTVSSPAIKGQQLPITAVAILPKGDKIQLEVAKTTPQQAMGLMYRPALPDNRGMLFPFNPPQAVSFWMKNVPVALDMVFVRDGVVQYIQASAAPCPKEPCPNYGPGNKLIDQVIELRSGRAAELGLKVGDRIRTTEVTN